MQVKKYDIKHLTILAEDEVKMRAFYRDLLNAVEEKTDKDEYSYSFRSGESPFLTLKFGAKPQAERQEGLYHMALLFPSAAELGALVQRLLTVQYPIGAGDHQVSEAIYLDDPDGNGIELYRDRPTDMWVWHDDQVEMGTYDVDIHGMLNQVDHVWSGFPEGMKIGHVHFSGRDLAVADNFFDNFLAMDTVLDLPRNAHFYSHNKYHHHHALNVWAGDDLVPKKLDERGLVDWQVEVDDDYFDLMRSRLDLVAEVYEEKPNSITIRDVVGSKMIITKKEITH